jgi:CRISPR-associated protein Csb2
MSKALLISVRFHDGRYHGAGDWPPSPARLFQALVAAAARPRLNDEKRKALRWFEKLDAPMIAAPTAYTGQPINLFVPNNDLDAKDGDIRRIAEIRSATKRIRPRLFDATVPLLYIWHFDGDESQAQCICNIADGLYQLGRGVDMAWAVGEQIDEARTEKLLSDYPGAIYRPSRGGKGLALDCPDEGSLVSLETRHQANAQRFSYVNGKIQFANAPKPRFRAVAYNSTTTHLLFELRCTTAPGTPFAPWPLKSAAALVRTLRDGACARLERHFNGSGVVEKVLIGRNATEADKTQRVRIIPLPSIGHVHAHPGIRRVLVEVPPNCPIRVDDMVWGFAGLEVAPPVHDDVTGEILSSPVELVRTEDDSMLAHYGCGAV